jgi:hypothetical protein
MIPLAALVGTSPWDRVLRGALDGFRDGAAEWLAREQVGADFLLEQDTEPWIELWLLLYTVVLRQLSLGQIRAVEEAWRDADQLARLQELQRQFDALQYAAPLVFNYRLAGAYGEGV